jgi:para-nitrobenzyl esterase
MAHPEVGTTNGTLRGTWENGTAVFRGVPFAAPPVGPNRFAAPRPAQKWDGVRDATSFGPPPPQPSRQYAGDDWLNLTVWTPEPGPARLPVVVWISGGGYLNCDSSNPHLDGAALAAGGAVVVSAHYRSGFEGWAQIEGAPANRALLDQLAALRWTQEEVAAFGGDPGNVTVFGQSAGAGSIAALLVMPSARGLFRRAILQSIPGTYLTPGLAADVADEICGGILRPSSAAELARVEPEALVEASRTITEWLPRYGGRWGSVAHTPTPFAPVVDGDVLPAAPWTALADGAARGVELLVGHTRDDFSLLNARLEPTDDAGPLIDGLEPTPGAAAYRAAYPELTPAGLRETALNDWLYRMPALHLAEAAHAGGARVWLYELCWGYKTWGASHGLDTLLVFGTTDVDGSVTAAGPQVLAAHDRLAALMRAEHLAFARRGDPGWARYEPRGRATRVYDERSSVAAYPEERSRGLWRGSRFRALGVTTSGRTSGRR